MVDTTSSLDVNFKYLWKERS